MAEDTRQPGEEKKSEPTRTGQRAAADDDLDIDIDSAPVKIQRGGSGLIWLVLAVIIVLGVVAYGVFKYLDLERQKEETRQQELRDATYQAQMDTITTNIVKAATSARAGNVEESLKYLDVAEKMLKTLGISANQTNDQQWYLKSKQNMDAVIAARQAIKEQYGLYQSTMEEQFGALESVFGVKTEGAPTEETETAEGAEGTEGAETGTAVEPEQPAAGTESPEAGAAEPVAPVAPEAGAAEGTPEQPAPGAAAPEQPAPAPAPAPGA